MFRVVFRQIYVSLVSVDFSSDSCMFVVRYFLHLWVKCKSRQIVVGYWLLWHQFCVCAFVNFEVFWQVHGLNWCACVHGHALESTVGSKLSSVSDWKLPWALNR